MKLSVPILVACAALACGAAPPSGPESRPGGKTVTLAAFGDSTTAPRGSIRIYADCLKDDLPGKGFAVDVINAGVGGNSTADAKDRFAKDVLDRHPDIVVIQFGINDSTVNVWSQPPATKPPVTERQYQANLEHFIDALRKQNCSVILMTPNPMRWTPALKNLYGKPPYKPADPDGLNVTLRPYADGVRAVAKKKNVPLVDVYDAFQEYDKGKGRSIDDLLLDGMHPNDKGHRLVADLLIKQILKGKATGTAPGRGNTPTLRATP